MIRMLARMKTDLFEWMSESSRTIEDFAHGDIYTEAIDDHIVVIIVVVNVVTSSFQFFFIPLFI